MKGLAHGSDGHISKPFEAAPPTHAVGTMVGLPAAASAPNDLWVDKQLR